MRSKHLLSPLQYTNIPWNYVGGKPLDTQPLDVTGMSITKFNTSNIEEQKSGGGGGFDDDSSRGGSDDENFKFQIEGSS